VNCPAPQLLAVVALLSLSSGCDRVGLGQHSQVPDGAPSEDQLKPIAYMSSEPGPGGRKVYRHYEEAKTCGDFELALRWNRPPNVEGGPFHRKMQYLGGSLPADLPKDSEVFITAKIEKGETLPSGSTGWILRMHDGARVQAVETADFWAKQEQESEDGKYVALVKPEKPGRILCAQAVYQGQAGKGPDQDQKVPVFAVLFAMDREG